MASMMLRFERAHRFLLGLAFSDLPMIAQATRNRASGHKAELHVVGDAVVSELTGSALMPRRQSAGSTSPPPMASRGPSRGAALLGDARARARARLATKSQPEVPLRCDLTLVPDMPGTRHRMDRLPARRADGNITGNHAKDHT